MAESKPTVKATPEDEDRAAMFVTNGPIRDLISLEFAKIRAEAEAPLRHALLNAREDLSLVMDTRDPRVYEARVQSTIRFITKKLGDEYAFAALCELWREQRQEQIAIAHGEALLLNAAGDRHLHSCGGE